MSPIIFYRQRRDEPSPGGPNVCLPVFADIVRIGIGQYVDLFGKRELELDFWYFQVDGNGELHIYQQMSDVKTKVIEHYAHFMGQIFHSGRVLMFSEDTLDIASA